MITLVSLTLEEIKSLKDERLIEEYNSNIKNLQSDLLSRKVVEANYGEPIEYIYEQIEYLRVLSTSNYYFPGDIILMYLGIREHKSKDRITCDFSGATINKGTSYVSYRPLLVNLNSNQSYVLKRTLKVESSYVDILPSNISELEDLTLKLKIDTYESEYCHLSQRVGGEFTFQKLRRRRI